MIIMVLVKTSNGQVKFRLADRVNRTFLKNTSVGIDSWSESFTLNSGNINVLLYATVF